MTVERESRADRIATQARRISVDVSSVSSTNGTTVTVTNRSSEPIFKLFVQVIANGTTSTWFHVRQQLAPATSIDGTCDLKVSVPLVPENTPSWPAVAMWFVDAEGRWWKVDHLGDLTPNSGPPDGYDPNATALLG